jgi:hypothetical protein
VLLDIPEQPGAVVGQSPAAQLPDLSPEDGDRPRRRSFKAGEDPKKCRLSGPAGAQDDEHFAVLDPQRQPLERSRVPLRRRVDAEHVPGLDRGHRATPRVAPQMSAAAPAA